MIAFLLIVIFLGTIENKISKFYISEYSGLYKIELLMSYINVSAWYLLFLEKIITFSGSKINKAGFTYDAVIKEMGYRCL